MSERGWDLTRMRRLLREWDEFVRRDRYLVSWRWREEVVQAGTVLRPPCSEEQVAAAEQRLGKALPPSYRAFLLLSNGAYASSLGTETAGDDPHGFLPVEQVDWMPAAHAQWVDLWCDFDSTPEVTHPAPGRPTDVSDFARARHGLLISRPYETYNDILVPAAEGDEWELWTTAKEGATSHYSFADYLIYHMQHRREPAPEPAIIEHYAAAAADGDGQALALLSELDAARAARTAITHLNNPEQSLWTRANAAHVLGSLAAAGVVDTLGELRRQRGRNDRAMARYLLTALALAGDEDAVAELRQRIAANPENDDSRHARRALAQCGLTP